MKTLILNGSTKRDGDTTVLLREMTKHLDGEIRTISHESNIAPCTDCRFCWKHFGCAIEDGMQSVYPYLDACDHVILASPIWFSSLSGPLLTLASRLQTLYAGVRFRGEAKSQKKKNGVIIIVGAEKGTEKAPIQNALTILKLMNVRRPVVATVRSLDTDNIPAKEDRKALMEAAEAAQQLKALYRGGQNGGAFSS